MGFSVFMNIAGGIFAITAIVLYGMDLRDTSLLWICDRSSDDAVLDEDNCRNVALFAQVIQPKHTFTVYHNCSKVVMWVALTVLYDNFWDKLCFFFILLCSKIIRNYWNPWTSHWSSWLFFSWLSIFVMLFGASELCVHRVTKMSRNSCHKSWKRSSRSIPEMKTDLVNTWMHELHIYFCFSELQQKVLTIIPSSISL